jgi:hypothetical protein
MSNLQGIPVIAFKKIDDNTLVIIDLNLNVHEIVYPNKDKLEGDLDSLDPLRGVVSFNNPIKYVVITDNIPVVRPLGNLFDLFLDVNTTIKASIDFKQ